MGARARLTQSVNAVRNGGHISLIGILGGHGKVPTMTLMLKQARLEGITVGSRRQQDDMVRGIDATGLRPVLDRSFGLDGLADAFRHEAAGAHFGKICVEF